MVKNKKNFIRKYVCKLCGEETCFKANMKKHIIRIHFNDIVELIYMDLYKEKIDKIKKRKWKKNKI